ncbi:bifunctional diguanylate cyclase/phosphodiesterase [Alteromonadaceae bacterium BrNp21-10]|nr:bifunctional diguanylate cyclase/phosphodiesterase [Alteromonadaceae bacterium BrNp21-10]
MNKHLSAIASSQSIRTRLILICAMIVAVLATALSAFSYRIHAQTVIASEQHALLQSAELVYQLLKDNPDVHYLNPHQAMDISSSEPVAWYLFEHDMLLFKSDLRLEFPDINVSEIEALGQTGWMKSANQRFLWAIADSESSSLKLVVMKQPILLDASLIEVKMTIVGIALLCAVLGIWGIFVLGTLIGRQQESYTRELTYKATHDALTDLFNREQMVQCIEDFIQQENQQHNSQPQLEHRARAAMLFFDIDRFKEVNDALGHDCGDLLLQRLSDDIGKMLREDDVFARFGGDEFAIWVPDIDRASASVLGRRLLNLVQQPIEIEGVYIEVGLSVGIANYPDDALTASSLISCADIAMYTAKRQRIGVAHFHPDQEASTIEQLQLTSDLRQAISNKELVLYYQPKVDLASEVIIGCEVLIRWQHPTLGFLSADRFVHLAECSGIINEFTRYIIEHALLQNAQWQQQGIALPMSVNISPYNLNDPYFVDFISEKLASTQVAAGFLELELTENGALTDIVRTQQQFEELKNIGVSLSIDDFGTGMSSLAYVKNLKVDAIKIDRSFVTNVVYDKGDQAIVSTILGLCENLQRKSIAEGIESPSIASKLRSMGCDMGQGDYFGRPMANDAFLTLYQNQTAE